jgi:mRNA interferase RelE/StbE
LYLSHNPVHQFAIFWRLRFGKIEQLTADPFSPNNNVKKLTGISAYRLRMGDWRIIYEIYDDRLVILVIAVAPRGGVYK